MFFPEEGQRVRFRKQFEFEDATIAEGELATIKEVADYIVVWPDLKHEEIAEDGIVFDPIDYELFTPAGSNEMVTKTTLQAAIELLKELADVVEPI